MDRHHYKPARENPSFSSSLLDEIYRSIDEQRDDQELMVYRKTSRSNYSINGCFQNDQQDIAKWMEKQVCEKVVVRRRSDFKNSWQQRRDYLNNSSSSSSDSSCGGGFSSSEAESASSRPKPIPNRLEEYSTRYGQLGDLQTKPKHQGKFVKTKSIYGDLKKVKQPISPGGRLATFLNSLFSNGNAKNPKLAYDDDMDRQSKSTCSSASSFSRSCLSKTPSSRGKLRSVRFFPESLYGSEESNLQSVKNTHTEELKIHSSEKNHRIEEAARNLLRNYQKKVECEFDLITNNVKSQNEIDMNYEEEEDDDDNDAASHTSSDLFELENFSAIGMDTYRDELPVYETTHLDTNLAIGNGFLM